jgi:hypothetical protein
LDVSSDFLFPSRTLDDTLRRLIEHNGDAIAATVERESRLPIETLGRLYEVKTRLSENSLGR